MSDETVATKPITPGAGVNPKRVVKPSKRFRNWYRIYRERSSDPLSLKAWARDLASTRIGSPELLARADVAKSWMANKGMRP